MPNYCDNHLKMKGASKLDLFQKDGITLDFNRILPMPESLDVTEGSVTKTAIHAYLLDKKDGKRKLSEKEKELLKDCKRFSDEKTLRNEKPEKFAELVEQGKVYVDNLEKYGHTSWYGWCVENWGTKWNAFDGWQDGEDEIGFVTAWSPPMGVICELSKKYPEERITVEWSEEGGYSGRFSFENGELVEDEENEPSWDDEDEEEEEVDVIE